MPLPRALGRDRAPKADRHRLNTGRRTSAPHTSESAGSSWHHSPKVTRSRSTQWITAKAPTLESFKISSFRSRLWWEARASHTSQKPSRWMPPVTQMGRAASTAPVKIV